MIARNPGESSRLGHAQFRRDRGTRECVGVGRRQGPQTAEELESPRLRVVLLQLVEDVIDQGKSPVALEQAFECLIVRRFPKETVLGVDRQVRPTAAALQCPIAIAYLCLTKAICRFERQDGSASSIRPDLPVLSFV